jgi:hypothetical protein
VERDPLDQAGQDFLRRSQRIGIHLRAIYGYCTFLRNGGRRRERIVCRASRQNWVGHLPSGIARERQRLTEAVRKLDEILRTVEQSEIFRDFSDSKRSRASKKRTKQVRVKTRGSFYTGSTLSGP